MSSFFQTMCIDFPNKIRKFEDLAITQPQTSYYLAGTDKIKNVTLVTAPKSGTHLLIKILRLLGVSYKSNSINHAYAPHLSQYADFFAEGNLEPEKLKAIFDPKQKYIVTIRDPKDFIISYIQWIGKEMKEGRTPICEAWLEASMQEKLEDFFIAKESKFKCLEEAPIFVGNYVVAAKLMKLALPNILFLRFEDLIGPKMGGSSKKRQLKALKNLCKFTQTKITARKLEKLIKLLPGNTLTYIDQRKTKKWLEHFQPRHLSMYLTFFSKLEKDLGYDTDYADIRELLDKSDDGKNLKKAS